MFDLNKYLNSKSELVDAYMQESLKYCISPLLLESMRYSLLAGGKRFRPILAMSVWDMLSEEKENYEKIKPLIIALEMLHTYSLIHDDLPSMDNDDLRRGKPTNHKVYGEAVAILAGDALLTQAFAELIKLKKNFPVSRVLAVIEYISRATGMDGMVGGQVLDILNDGSNSIDAEYIKVTYNAKTGELIKASVVAPALLLGKDDDVPILESYGASIGLAFQISDDVIGVVSSREDLGKTPGKDEENNKITFVELHGLKGATETAKKEINKAKEVLFPYGQEAEPFRCLADFIASRTF